MRSPTCMPRSPARCSRPTPRSPRLPSWSIGIPTVRAGCWSSRRRARATGISCSPRSSTSSSSPTAPTDALSPSNRPGPARHAGDARRPRHRGRAGQDPGQVAPGPPAGAATRAGRDGADPSHARDGCEERGQRQPRLLSRRRRLRPLRAESDRSPDSPRRVLHGLHAISAGSEPGHAADDLRVPDDDRRADRDGRRQRVDLRRGVVAGRGGADGSRGDGPLRGRPGRRRSSALPARRCDVLRRAGRQAPRRRRARGRARRGRRHQGHRRQDRRARGPVTELLRLSRGRRGRRRDRPRRGGTAGRRGRSCEPRRARSSWPARRRHRRGRRAGPRRAAVVWWPVPRRLRRQERLRAAHAGAPRRRDGRSGRPARLRVDVANAGAAHPPRQGDVQHLHERGAVRVDGDDLSRDDRQAGPGPRGRALDGEGALRGGPADENPGRGASLRCAVLQRVHAQAPEARRARGRAAGEAEDPRWRPAQSVRSEARRLSARRGHREAHEGRDRRLRGCAGQGGGVMPYDNQRAYDRLAFELSSPGRIAYSLPEPDVDVAAARAKVPAAYLRKQSAELPELSELDVVRHYSRLSQMNYGVDTHFYPLGSCTMKYNPKINEDMARVAGFGRLHPLAPEAASQGALQLLHELAGMLAEIAGMDAVSLQPAAGAQGELAGVLMIRAYHESKGEKRTKVLIPDSAHGTNPASTAIAGYEVIEVKSDANGEVDLGDLASHLGADVAAFMITVPNTLGNFEPRIVDITEMWHAQGVQVYMDGANLNALLGITRPGDLGFDVCHFNLHKTFTTPQGGGGPGASPVGVKAHLEPFLPVPVVVKTGEAYALDWKRPKSIGKLQAFWGN